MNNGDWNWAVLNRDQLHMLKEAELTLGAEILLAYQPGDGSDDIDLTKNGLIVAGLNPSQVECLQGLEQAMQVVVVAYNH